MGLLGFHDLRRGYATANAEHMDLFELQKLMQHRSLETTRGYANMAGKLKKAIKKVHVPSFLAVRETFTSLPKRKTPFRSMIIEPNGVFQSGENGIRTRDTV